MQFEDIHLSDTQLYALFRQYYTQGNYSQALNLLSQNPQLNLKTIIADNMNELSERIYGMENVYYVEVEEYLSNLFNNMQTNLNNLSNQNQFNQNIQYYVNNFVYYNNEVYFCIKEPPIGTIPTNQEYWLYLGLLGDKGKYGISNLSFVGLWDENTLYRAYQVVYVGYNFYWATQDNQGKDPTIEANQYWSTLIQVTPQKIIASSTVPTNLNTNDFWFQTK